MESQLDSKNMAGWLVQLLQERQTITALAEKANLGPERRCDIHLCYGDVPEIIFKGFLVTWRGNLDRLVAYRPVITRSMHYGSRPAIELQEGFKTVTRIAAFPDTAKRYADVLWLDGNGNCDCAVPGWVYGLRCVPLGGEWNGKFKSPRPFCPELFEQMARQPQAVRWLARQSIISPVKITEDSVLSKRVRQVLACLKTGYTEKETADALGISRNTIHEHVKHLYRHFHVHSRGELLSLFLEQTLKI